MMRLYNTLHRKKEPFKPLDDKQVSMYTCGPTVYNYMHIGNLRSFVFADTLRRVLEYNGHKVQHVMNITDVGHLTDDADAGEDKMEVGAKREGKTAWDIAAFYTEAFKADMKTLRVREPGTWCVATDHMNEQIAQVQQLIDKGYTYETSDGIYFDTTKLDDYGKLAQLDKQELQAGARVDMGEKKDPHDFALWKFNKPGETRQMQWEAFGRTGFPGWHIECSAMSMKYLGDHFDIHTGGIDHIPVHHTNEIAQAEAVLDEKPWVNYWLHNGFLNVDGEKMSKSKDNFYTLKDISEKGYDPLAYRYFLLQTHYRKPVNFTWDAIEAADQALKNLREHIQRIKSDTKTDSALEETFKAAVNDDLNTAEALAVLWNGIRDNSISHETIAEFDKVLGLGLVEDATDLPADIKKLLDERQQARENKEWEKSDELRDEIAEKGWLVEDTDDGQRIIKK